MTARTWQAQSEVGLPGFRLLTGQFGFRSLSSKNTENKPGKHVSGFFVSFSAQQHKQFVCVVQAFNQGSPV